MLCTSINIFINNGYMKTALSLFNNWHYLWYYIFLNKSWNPSRKWFFNNIYVICNLYCYMFKSDILKMYKHLSTSNLWKCQIQLLCLQMRWSLITCSKISKFPITLLKMNPYKNNRGILFRQNKTTAPCDLLRDTV